MILSDVPELPRSPVLPKLPVESSKSHMLPSISNKGGGKMGDQMVKSAVTDSDSDTHVSIHSPAMMQELHRDPSSEDDHKKEVFVKLDKFNQAQRTFEEIKLKMVEIEALVNKAKQINEREKEELTGWNEELHSIKTKVGEIDSEVFNQV